MAAKPMTKSQLVSELADKLSATKKGVNDYLDTLCAIAYKETKKSGQFVLPGFGKLVWFGIPLYDDRSRFPKEHKAQDTGGTAMFIFTPGGEVFADRSAHDRDWITVDKQLRPLFVEALETAWQRGFLLESRGLADYRVTGMNLGWEVPGLFDVEMQVRGLGLEVSQR